MKKIFHIIAAVVLMASCNRKQVPQATLPTIANPCDDAIQAILDSVQNVEPTYIYDVITEAGLTDTVRIVDSTSCNQIKIQALEIVSKYNSIIKERDFYKALSQSQAKKIVNNYNINSKNKNSQIGDGNVDQNSKSGTNQNGNNNEAVIKPKNSATGEGSSVDNSKKGLNWWWILLCGYLLCHVIHKILIPLAMRFVPFANVVRTVSAFFIKLKFW